MRWKCSALFLICCRKDLSDRGEVFDPVLSRWGPSERLYKLQRERRSPKHWYLFSGISCSPSSQPRYPSGVLGYHAGSALQPEQSFCGAAQRLLQNSTRGVLPASREGPGEGRAPRGATSARKEQSGRRGALGMLLNEEPERLRRLQGQLRGTPRWGEARDGTGGWRGRQGQPGGLSSAQPRAVLHAGCRRSAGLGAGRLSIFSEGFIEWIPAVWLHTEILS